MNLSTECVTGPYKRALNARKRKDKAQARQRHSWSFSTNSYVLGDFATLAKAKAAAQADYEQRIRSALVDVPAVEPVAWSYEYHDFGDVWARHVILNRPGGGANPPTKHHGSPVRNVRPLYTHPPLKEGEDSAEVIGKARALATAILQNFGAMEDGNGEEAPELAMARDLLAATRSASATTAKGCAE